MKKLLDNFSNLHDKLEKMSGICMLIAEMLDKIIKSLDKRLRIRAKMKKLLDNFSNMQDKLKK